MKSYLATTLTVLTLSIFSLIAEGANGDDKTTPKACYLPVENNVSYSQVTELSVDKPSAIISYGSDALQYGELWLPPSPFVMEKPPLVVLIHGGCWLNAFDIQHTHALSTALARSGYAVWSIEYRRTGDAGGGWPGSFNDIRKATKFVLHGEFDLANKIDQKNIAIVGHSAGGHLALLAGARLKNNSQIKAVIGLAAITDITRYASGSNSCESATPRFMGGTYKAMSAEYDDANPTLQAAHPSTILLHGDQDSIVNIEQASLIKTASVVKISGAGHFDMVHPGTASFQALLKQLARLL